MGRVIYLLDTNVVSEMMRPRPNPAVQAKWRTHIHQMAIAAVTWHELWFGVERMPLSQRRKGLESFLWEEVQAFVPVWPYDQAAAEWHSAERARLVGVGRPPSYPDGQIAAIAAVHRLTLVTRNTADFAVFTGLAVENWFG